MDAVCRHQTAQRRQVPELQTLNPAFVSDNSETQALKRVCCAVTVTAIQLYGQPVSRKPKPGLWGQGYNYTFTSVFLDSPLFK